MNDAPPSAAVRRTLPPTVWALGLVSLFMDLSSEIIHSLLPLFMTATLGLSVVAVGIVDGLAEATAQVTKVASGYVSDRTGRRKPLVLFGYGLAALSKPLFPLAYGLAPILAARLSDRFGKGIRGAPRDALIADVTPAEIRGRAFGLRQALDTAGAFIGPLAAIALMALFASDIRLVFWVAIIPAFLSVLLVLLAVHEPSAPLGSKPAARPRFAELGRMGRLYWTVIAVAVLFTLARFSEAFLVLKASAEGLPLWLAPLVLVVMNLVYSVGAYPAGIWADRISPRRLLFAGLAALIGADLFLALGAGLPSTFVGIALWGLHMALTQGLLSKMVADVAAPHLRGSAFGLFGVATGVAMLLASALAGWLWVAVGPAATFLAGAAFAAVSAASLPFLPARTVGRL